MICLIQLLYWESTGKTLPCKNKQCEFYGGDSCYAKKGEDN